MANPYAVAIQGSDGITTLQGELTFTDSENQPASIPVPVSSGAASPGPGGLDVTPTAIGELFIDTTDGGLYIALGLTSDDWVAVGGGTDGTIVGVAAGPGDTTTLVGNSSGDVRITDAAAQVNHSNGITWRGGGADGDQSAFVQTGSTGQHTTTLGDPDGNMTLAENLIIPNLPGTDPGVAGALFQTAGAVMVSAG